MSHLSFLILILSPLSSHFVWFGSLHSISKSKNKLKFYTKNYYPILSKSPLPSFPFPYPPFLFPLGHPEPPHSPNPPEPRSLPDHLRPDLNPTLPPDYHSPQANQSTTSDWTPRRSTQPSFQS